MNLESPLGDRANDEPTAPIIALPVPSDDNAPSAGPPPGRHSTTGRFGSVFGRTIITAREDTASPVLGEAELKALRLRTIEYIGEGKTAASNIETLWSFLYIGKAFRRDASSFNDVATALAKSGTNVPCSPQSISRKCARIQRFFNIHFGTTWPLFIKGKNRAYTGLTPVGKVALFLARKYLKPSRKPTGEHKRLL